LLDCQWKYDGKVKHACFNNTYSFVKIGVKIILGPFKRGLISKPFKEMITFFVTCCEMEKTC
jgi:hypothetical protein